MLWQLTNKACCLHLSVQVIIPFGINLELICTSEFFKKLKLHEPLQLTNAISAFWKTRNCKLIQNWTRKTIWLLINNISMKKICVEELSEDLFSQSFPTKIVIIILCYIIGIEYFLLSFSKSKSRITMSNLHWCYTWTALLSTNQNQVVFSCILLDT